MKNILMCLIYSFTALCSNHLAASTSDLSGREFATLEDVQEILSLADEVEELNLSQAKFHRDLVNAFLSGTYPQLKKLNLDGSNVDLFTVVPGFADNLESLSMRVNWGRAGSGNLHGLMNLPKLKTLKLAPFNVRYLTFDFSGLVLPQLETLDLRGGPGGIVLFFDQFSPNLKHLSLGGSRLYVSLINANGALNDSVFNSIFVLKQLETLDLREHMYWNQELGWPSGFDLRNLLAFDAIRKLELSYTLISPENIEQTQLMTLPFVEQFAMDHCKIKGARYSNFIPNVKRLSLAGSNITGGDMAEIALLNSLEVLNIEDTSITGASLKKLNALSQLSELSLAQTDMVKADFTLLPKSLKQLNLSHCKLSLASFNTLFTLTQLKTLDLQHIQNSNITSDHIEQLKAALPDCKINR